MTLHNFLWGAATGSRSKVHGTQTATANLFGIASATHPKKSSITPPATVPAITITAIMMTSPSCAALASKSFASLPRGRLFCLLGADTLAHVDSISMNAPVLSAPRRILITGLVQMNTPKRARKFPRLPCAGWL